LAPLRLGGLGFRAGQSFASCLLAFRTIIPDFGNNSRFRGRDGQLQRNLLASVFCAFDFKPSSLPQPLPEKHSLAFLYVLVSGPPTVRLPQANHPTQLTRRRTCLGHPAQPGLVLDRVFIKHLDFVHIFLYVFNHLRTSRSTLVKQRLRNTPFNNLYNTYSNLLCRIRHGFQ
jgi:hypothetical protein